MTFHCITYYVRLHYIFYNITWHYATLCLVYYYELSLSAAMCICYIQLTNITVGSEKNNLNPEQKFAVPHRFSKSWMAKPTNIHLCVFHHFLQRGGRTTPTYNGGDNSSPPPETPKSMEPPSHPETPRDFNTAPEDPSTLSKGKPAAHYGSMRWE